MHLTEKAHAMSTTSGFPFDLPDTKPDRPLSAAVARNYDHFATARPDDNELFSKFCYTPIEGLNDHDFDGTVTRRDPSKVIRENGRYYVWYTHRHTAAPVSGCAKATDTVPARDWDLSEIWYATSDDGFIWQEQGVAAPRAARPAPGWRSVSTPDILKWKGRFYLYYQAFSVHPSEAGDDCPVALSVADTPDGPWEPLNQVVIPNGPEDTWDSRSIHDPYPLVYKGKIYLYYKSDFDTNRGCVRMQGLATADDPRGPFTKHPLNPVLNSGHETTLFPFREGIAALAIRDGNEHFTIQYAADGVNFDVAAISELLPVAAGPYVPDAFTDTGDGRGITWGLCHNISAGKLGTAGNQCSVLMRFDCSLSRDHRDPELKKHCHYPTPDVYYRFGLTAEQRKRIGEACRAAANATHPTDSPRD